MTASELGMLVVADDLTGAADTAVAFAEAGHRSRVDFDSFRGRAAGGEVVAIDTNTRHAGARDAAQRVSTAVSSAPASRRYLKKVDSMLRGHLYGEIAAMLSATGRRLAVCAPAFPATGRMTRGGVQWADGMPVRDLRAELAGLRPAHLDLATVRGCQLADVLRGLAGATALALVDAVTEDDLARLVRAAVPLEGELLWVGCGGLGQALAGELPHAGVPGPAPGLVSGGVLVIVGSPTATAAAQGMALRANGVHEVRFPAAPLMTGNPGVVRSAAEQVAAVLRAGGDVLVNIGTTGPIPASLGPTVVGTLADSLAAAGVSPGALVATGGETARRVIQALGATAIQLIGQLEPGVVVGQLAGGPGCPVVTKSGSFGAEHSLVRAVQALRSLALLCGHTERDPDEQTTPDRRHHGRPRRNRPRGRGQGRRVRRAGDVVHAGRDRRCSAASPGRRDLPGRRGHPHRRLASPGPAATGSAGRA